jgi:hypothetical protein
MRCAPGSIFLCRERNTARRGPLGAPVQGRWTAQGALGCPVAMSLDLHRGSLRTPLLGR